MALESATYIHQLDVSSPAPNDPVRQADDHLRLIKQAIQNTFPNVTGPVTLDQAGLNSTLPVGMVMMWYGTSALVPSGWALCDGSTVTLSGGGTIVTPDLRGRAPVGVAPELPLGSTFGGTTATANTSGSGSHTHTATGGEHTHAVEVAGTALSLTQIPSHNHFVAKFGGSSTDTAPTNANYLQATRPHAGDSNYDLDGTPAQADVLLSSAAGSGAQHTHTATTASSTHTHTIATAPAHTHTVTHSTVQPSLAIHFIMKV